MKIIIFIVLLLSVSCNPLKHYQGVATDTSVTEEKKRIIAPWVGLYFPAEVKYIKGKDSIITDTLIDIKDFDSLQNEIDLLYAKGFDSLKACQLMLVSLMQDCKPTKITITKLRTDTLFQESGPMINRLKYERDNSIANEIIINTKYNDTKDTIKTLKGKFRNLWWIIIILALALTGSVYLHFKRR